MQLLRSVSAIRFQKTYGIAEPRRLRKVRNFSPNRSMNPSYERHD